MGLRLEPAELHLKLSSDAALAGTTLLLENPPAVCSEDHGCFLPPEQLLNETNARLGLEVWDPEHFPMMGCSTAPLDTSNTSGFIAELMESAIPSSSNTADATLCDVSFITELMECDFSHQPHPEHHNFPGKLSTLEASHSDFDAIDVALLTPSKEHPHCHHSKTQLFASTHGNDDGMDLDIHQSFFSLLQDACNLHEQGKSPVQDVDDNEGRPLDANAHDCTKRSHGFQGHNDDTDMGTEDPTHPSIQAFHGSNLQESQNYSQARIMTGSQIDDGPQTPTFSSDDSGSEDASLRFSPCGDVAKEEMSAPLAEGGSIHRHQPETEQLKHCEDSNEKTQESNLNLLHLLLACAEAVSEDDFEVASVVLSRLQERSCEYGTPLQRLAFYLSDALEARIMPSSKEELCQSLRMPLPACDMLEAFCVFYNVNPIGRFCHLTLNQLILDTTLSDTAVHIVDLHIGYGMQWAAFLYAVALRPCGPPKLTLTGIGPMEEPLVSTGKKLMDVATSLQMSFEFCPIVTQLHELRTGMISVRDDEVCVISSLGQLHTLLHRGSDYVDNFIAGLKSLNPKVLVLAENDVDHNNPLFLHRFVECMRYYAAVFESLDASLPPSSQARLKIERLLCGRKIGSIVACESVERVERHETMCEWMSRLERLNFRNAEITYAAINQAKLLLNIYYPNGYSLTEDGNALTLRWNGTALMAIGIWH